MESAKLPRRLTQKEVRQRGCYDCSHEGKVVKDGKQQYKTCPYAKCPYHEMDRHERYKDYLASKDAMPPQVITEADPNDIVAMFNEDSNNRSKRLKTVEMLGRSSYKPKRKAVK